MTYSQTFIALMLGILATCLLLYKRRKVAPLLPPSLTGYPIVGNLFQLPSSDEYVAYRDIGNQLRSDVISFTVFGQVIVVLNSIEAAKDLLVKRGSMYSDRAELPMVNDEKLVGWGKNTGFLRYGERWRNQRTITETSLHPDAGEELWPRMIRQVRLSMQRLLHGQKDVTREIQWMTAAMILSAVYGYEAAYPTDTLVQLVETSVRHLSEAGMPANFYVNTLPWLKYVPSWLPGAGWKRKADLWRAEKDRTMNEPFEWTKSQMAANVAMPSILKTLLTELTTNEPHKHSVEEREDIIRWATGTLYVAGADTTVSSMATFILAMILHPWTQKKVQAELDAVLGEGRLPELSDREALPYLNAVLKEVMRWRPVAPLGVPRACSQDNEYKGFIIPKGSIVLGNIWAISNDASIYPAPQDFNPDRFYKTTVPEAPSFGFGRRDCPGAHFAESSLFLMASTFLTIFDVTSTPGKPIPEATTQLNLLVVHPTPFECTVTPRSDSRRRLIEQWIEA